MKRSQTSSTVDRSLIGQEVILCGWVNSRRDHGGLIFIDLRDREGLVQAVFNPETDADLHAQAHGLRNEFVVCLRGTVRPRPEGTENPRIASGEVEVAVLEMEILNACAPLPFEITEDKEVGEDVRLAYRYLDLRRPRMRNNIITRSRIFQACREVLYELGFVDVETPILTKSTPEGARDYLVPSRLNPGLFYALPQSPQLFKQLLMVSGLERYFQVAKCFRDEDLRRDRQPEFTQLDLEMSFIDEDDIFSVSEQVMARMFQAARGFVPELPFPRMSYEEAVRRFGSDKPDLRFGMEIIDLSQLSAVTNFQVFKSAVAADRVILGLGVKGGAELSLKELDELIEFAKTSGLKGLVWVKVAGADFQSPVRKHLGDEFLRGCAERLGCSEGDLMLLVAEQPRSGRLFLGQLRIKMIERMRLEPRQEFSLVWITDFPMFHYNDEEQRWDSEHHPFTAPREEDIPLLESDPGKVRSRAYDLVINGNEIGSGSIRIHQRALQERIFKILGLNPEDIESKFGFLLKAFSFGAPPHGGAAYGLDRLTALLTGSGSIREVIPFPKTQKAYCPLTSAPSEVSSRQLEELNLTITE